MARVSYNSYTLLDNQTSAGDGTAIALDYRFEGGQVRGIAGTLNASDTIEIQVSADNSTWYTAQSYPEATETEFVGVLEGPWPYVRASKTGANGAATVILVG